MCSQNEPLQCSCLQAKSVCSYASHGQLCYRYGVSKRLFEDFLRPLLLVGLFAPAEELSAAVVIGTLYFYGKPVIL